MKNIALAIFILIFAGIGNAEEGDTITSTACPGNWVLEKSSGWVVRNDAGMVLPLTSGTEIFGCGRIPAPLSDDLSGASVDIICTPSPVENGLPDVISLTIVCE